MNTHMGEIEEILSAFKQAALKPGDGEAQYRDMLEATKRNERKLEPEVGDKIVGTMFIMVRGDLSSGLEAMSIYPANIPKGMADQMRTQKRIENWDAWLKEAIMRGEADI